MEPIIAASWNDLKVAARDFMVELPKLSKEQGRYLMTAWRFTYQGFEPKTWFERRMGLLLNSAVIQTYTRWKISADRVPRK